MHQAAGRTRARIVCAAVAACVAALLPSGCEDPEAPPPAGSVYQGGYDPGSGTLRFRLESPTGAATPLELVATSISFDPALEELHALVAIHNGGVELLPGPAAVFVAGFVPPEVRPVNAMCLLILCAPPPADCFDCFFDHHGTYGSDELLSPGETSTPVEWILHDPGGGGFAFRARMDAGLAGGVIAGTAFLDLDRNGHHDEGETGIPDVPISLRFGGSQRSVRTDGRGHYEFAVAEPGIYEVVREVDPNDRESCRPTTPLALRVFVVRKPDGSLSGTEGADFGCSPPLVFTGVVYADANRNGQPDPGEPGIAGVTVCVASPCRCVPNQECMRTDANGRYVFVDPSTCCRPQSVSHEPVAGMEDTGPNPVIFPVPPLPGEPLRVDFGLAPVP